MSLRLTRKGFITSVDNLPEMRGLAAYLAGRRAFRDDAGHDTGAASGGDDDNAGEDDDPDDEEDEDETEDDDKSSKGKKKGEDDDEETVPKWKYEKLHNRMTAADRNAQTLRQQLEELKNSKDINADVKRELEEIKSNVGKVEKERDELVDKNKGLTIKLAAVAMSTVDGMPQWEDVDVALGLADLSDVDVSDDGKVDKRALKSALRALAKEKPYLTKKKAKASADDANEQGDGTNGSTGPKMAGKRKGDSGAPDRAALAARFPALNRVG